MESGTEKQFEHFNVMHENIMSDICALSSKENSHAIVLLGNIINKHISAPIYFTGIGKPAFLAMKLAATGKSISINSNYLDANMAGHGDLGNIPMQTDSLLIAISKSGLSKELFELFDDIKALRHKCHVVLLCMSTDEQYEKINAINSTNKTIDEIVRLSIDTKELDGCGIIPSYSNAIFEYAVDMSYAIATNAYDKPDMLYALRNAHPSGTLYAKTCSVIACIERSNWESLSDINKVRFQLMCDKICGKPGTIAKTEYGKPIYFYKDGSECNTNNIVNDLMLAEDDIHRLSMQLFADNSALPCKHWFWLSDDTKTKLTHNLVDLGFSIKFEPVYGMPICTHDDFAKAYNELLNQAYETIQTDEN